MDTARTIAAASFMILGVIALVLVGLANTVITIGILFGRVPLAAGLASAAIEIVALTIVGVLLAGIAFVIQPTLRRG